MATNASESAKNQVRKAAPGLTLLARAGYAAKGVVYVVIGWLAARAAAGMGGKTTDTSGAIRVIGDGPLGKSALVIIGVGLLGYMVWRLVAAATDAERKGDRPTNLAVRLTQAARGLAYGALGVRALRELTARPPRSGSADQTRHWTSRLLEMPFGKLLVIAAGLGVIGYALYQLYRASTDKVKNNLDLADAGPTAAMWILRLGRFGVGARAVVFGVIGVFMLRAAIHHDPKRAGGIAESLAALAAAPYGRFVLGVVALGLIAYGVHQLATARYRRIRAVG